MGSYLMKLGSYMSIEVQLVSTKQHHASEAQKSHWIHFQMGNGPENEVTICELQMETAFQYAARCFQKPPFLLHPHSLSTHPLRKLHSQKEWGNIGDGDPQNQACVSTHTSQNRTLICNNHPLS